LGYGFDWVGWGFSPSIAMGKKSLSGSAAREAEPEKGRYWLRSPDVTAKQAAEKTRFSEGYGL
jgi:hypothetical protein